MDAEKTPASLNDGSHEIRWVVDLIMPIIQEKRDAVLTTTVLERAMQGVTDRVRMAMTFRKPTVTIDSEKDVVKKVSMNVSLGCTDIEYAGLGMCLSRTRELLGSTLPIPDVIASSRMLLHDHPLLLKSMLDERYGDDVRDVTDAFVRRIANGGYVRQELADEKAEVADSVVRGLWGFEKYAWLEERKKEHPRESMDLNVENFFRIIRTQFYTREHLLMNVRHVMRAGEVDLARAIARQGYYTMRDMDERTDYDWYESNSRRFTKTLEAHAIEKSLQEPRSIFQPPERSAIRDELSLEENIPEYRTYKHLIGDKETISKEKQQAVIECNRFIRKHMIEMVDAGLLNPSDILDADDLSLFKKSNEYLKNNARPQRRRMRDALDSDRRKQELQAARDRQNYNEAAAIELSIATDVYRQIMRFPHEDVRVNRLRSYINGLPLYAAETGNLSCFTDTWAVAALCMECGIPYNQLYYCDVHESEQGDEVQRGTHAALLLALSDGQSIFIDCGFKRFGRPFSMDMCVEGRIEEQVRQFFLHSRHDNPSAAQFECTPVNVTVAQELADPLCTYREFTLMQLDQGFASGHFLHTGIAFLHEGQLDEAQYAFEMGLAFNEKCPDLWCYLGIVALRKNDLDTADFRLEMASNCFIGHMLSAYYRGVVALKEGKTDIAKRFFQVVADDKTKLWGDTSFRKHAQEYLENDKALQDALTNADMILR